MLCDCFKILLINYQETRDGKTKGEISDISENYDWSKKPSVFVFVASTTSVTVYSFKVSAASNEKNTTTKTTLFVLYINLQWYKKIL